MGTWITWKQKRSSWSNWSKVKSRKQKPNLCVCVCIEYSLIPSIIKWSINHLFNHSVVNATTVHSLTSLKLNRICCVSKHYQCFILIWCTAKWASSVQLCCVPVCLCERCQQPRQLLPSSAAKETAVNRWDQLAGSWEAASLPSMGSCLHRGICPHR